MPSFEGVLAEGVGLQDVTASVRWAAGSLWSDSPTQTLRVLEGAAANWVKYQGRATVARNVRIDPAKPRFARVPSGAQTCAFCLMLASRGWVYHSEKTAGMLTRFHTDCDCQIVPSFEKKAAHLSGYDPDAMFAVYKPAYAAAKAKHGGRAGESETAAMIREMFPDKVTDGKGRKRRSAYTPKKVARGASADGTMQVQKMVEYREFAERLLRERGLHESGRYRLPPEVPAEPPKDWPGDLPRLRAKEWNHILYGDIKRSGGHQYGYGWVNNRPEFPAHWSDQDIAQAIIAVLRKEEKVPGKRFLYSSRYGEESITVAVRAKGGVPIVRSAYVQGSR